MKSVAANLCIMINQEFKVQALKQLLTFFTRTKFAIHALKFWPERRKNTDTAASFSVALSAVYTWARI